MLCFDLCKDEPLFAYIKLDWMDADYHELKGYRFLTQQKLVGFCLESLNFLDSNFALAFRFTLNATYRLG